MCHHLSKLPAARTFWFPPCGSCGVAAGSSFILMAKLPIWSCQLHPCCSVELSVVPEPHWEQRMIGGGLRPFCQTRDSSFYMGVFSAAGRAQVPFTLRSLKLSRTFVTLPSPLITHGDLSCWEGQGVFLRKAPIFTQGFSEIFSSTWGMGRLALTQQCFPTSILMSQLPQGPGCSAFSLHSSLLSLPGSRECQRTSHISSWVGGLGLTGNKECP